MHEHTHTYTDRQTHTRTRARARAHTHTHRDASLLTFVTIHMHEHTHLHTRTHTDRHTDRQTDRHTHTHTHTHTGVSAYLHHHPVLLQSSSAPDSTDLRRFAFTQTWRQLATHDEARSTLNVSLLSCRQYLVRRASVELGNRMDTG